MITIAESGLEFGPLKESNLYHIETAPEYKRIEQGTKIAEFVFWKESLHRLVILEAKSSLADAAVNADNFQEQIENISQKFLNSLDLYLCAALKKCLHPHFESLDYNTVEFRFILVIRGYDRDGIRHVTDAMNLRLNRALRLRKIWLYSFCAINDHQAQTRGMLADKGSFWQ